MTTPKREVAHLDDVPGRPTQILFTSGRIRVQTVVGGRPQTYTIKEQQQ